MDDKKHLPIRKFPVRSVEVIVSEGYWARTENPHPLVTLDYDADGNLLQVVVIGGDLRVDTETNDPLGFAMIKGNPDLDHDQYVADYDRSRAKQS
jgi:hypothetical protein